MSKFNVTVPEGQRKLIATVIAMVAGIVADKYLGGLSDNLALLIGGALGLFVGGNAMEYVAQIKGTSSKSLNLPLEKEEVVEVAQEPEVTLESIHQHLIKLDNICGQVFAQNDKDIKGLQAAVKLNSDNTQKLIGMINGQRTMNETQQDR